MKTEEKNEESIEVENLDELESLEDIEAVVNSKEDYVTGEDCRELHAKAVAAVAKLHKAREGKKYTYTPHPTIPKTWIEREVKDTTK